MFFFLSIIFVLVYVQKRFDAFRRSSCSPVYGLLPKCKLKPIYLDAKLRFMLLALLSIDIFSNFLTDNLMVI
jgi:hypothetical protein